MKSKRQQLIDKVLEDIAKEHLRVPTLVTRKSDSLDFHDLAVWQLRAALDAAYQAGIAAAARIRPVEGEVDDADHRREPASDHDD
jgi:hypothetical protein